MMITHPEDEELKIIEIGLANKEISANVQRRMRQREPLLTGKRLYRNPLSVLYA